MDGGDAHPACLPALSRSRSADLGVILSRNYPRDFRYIMASNHFPKGRNCFVCYATALNGLTGLPRGGHMTVAPYSTAAREGQWTGARLSAEPVPSDSGVDFKWRASPKLTIDATPNPDFSQSQCE